MSHDPNEPVDPSAQDPYAFDPAQPYGDLPSEVEGLPEDDGSWFLQDDLADLEPAQTEQFEAVGALPDELGAAPTADAWSEAAGDDAWTDDGGAFDAGVAPLNDEDLVGASYVEPESTRSVFVRALVPGVVVLVLAFGGVGALAVLKEGSLDALLGTGESPEVDVRRSAPKRRAPGDGAELASIDGGARVGTRVGQTRDGSTFEAGSSTPTVEAPREPGELAPGAEPDPAPAPAPAPTGAPEPTTEPTTEPAAPTRPDPTDGRSPAPSVEPAPVDLADAERPEPALDPENTAGAPDPTGPAPAPAERTVDPSGEAPAAAAETADVADASEAPEPTGFGVPAEPAVFGDSPFVAVEDAPPGVFGATAGLEGPDSASTPTAENPLAAAFAAVGHAPDEPSFPLELVFATRGASEGGGPEAATDGAAPQVAEADAPPAGDETAAESAAPPGPGATFAYVPFGFDEGSGGGIEVSVTAREVEPMGPAPASPDAAPVREPDRVAEAPDAEPAGAAEPIAPEDEPSAPEPRTDPAEGLAAAEARLVDVFGPVGPESPFDPAEPPSTVPGDAAPAEEPDRSDIYPLPRGEAAAPGATPGEVVAAAEAPDGAPIGGAGPDGPPAGGTKDDETDTDESVADETVVDGAKPDATDPDATEPAATPPGAGETVVEAEPEVRPSIADQVEQKRRRGVLNRIDDGSVWRHRTVPKTKIRGDRFVLTPMVGNVRVVFAGGETIDGRLHGVGDGQVVLFTKIGRVKLESKRVDRIDRIGGGRRLPDPTAQASRTGLDHVRVRTKGGIFDGHLVSRDGDEVTLLMGKGVRVKLEAIEVTPFKGVRAGARIRRQDDGAEDDGSEDEGADGE